MCIFIKLCFYVPTRTSCPPFNFVGCIFCMGISTLYHEAWYDSMKYQSIIEADLCQFLKVFNGLWRIIWIKLHCYISKLCFYSSRVYHNSKTAVNRLYICTQKYFNGVSVYNLSRLSLLGASNNRKRMRGSRANTPFVAYYL